MLKELFVCRDHTKWLVFLIFSFFLCTQSFADYYRVTAPNGLNVRASANKNGEVLGQLSQDNVIDVISIENGWANFNYNGWQGYVSASYLEAVTDTGATGASAKEESWDLTSWLFDSEGESVWFTALKWILVIGIAIYLINLKSATKLFSVLLASKRPLITELADKLRLKYPLLPTISPCPTMRLEAIRSIIPISCRRYPKSV